jgi:pimeloyl-ACP methyl ester carboxylesterase
MDKELPICLEDKYLSLGDQGVIRYWQAGFETKPKIIFLHGIGSGIESWLNQFNFLSDYFFVTAIDLPGFGKSKLRNGRFDLKLFLETLEIFVQRKEMEKFSLIGHSLGGYLSLAYANTYPTKVDKLVLIASGGFGLPSGRFRFLGNRFSKLFLLPFVKTNILGPKIFSFFYGKGLPLSAYNKLSEHWKDPRVMKSFIEILKQSEKQEFVDTSSVVSPSLIIWGMNDWVLDYHFGIIAKSMLPNSTLRLFGKNGHGIHTEIPEIINPIILDFLS